MIARLKGMRMSGPFLPYLPVDAIRAAFAKSPGNEIASGKIDSPESSAALAANTFGLFLERPSELPELPLPVELGWPPQCVGIERCARFPWSGGHHPWLDAMIETPTHLIGVESKRYEPFRPKELKKFSDAYKRRVWGRHMKPFEAARDHLTDGSMSYVHLDAVQLVKHAFGIRTEAVKRRRGGKQPVLMYLFAQSMAWPDGRPIPATDRDRHCAEIADFADAVSGAEVKFVSCSYDQLLAAWSASASREVRDHAAAIAERFHPCANWPESGAE